MKNKIYTFPYLLFLISLTLSFKWPLENARITSTFGESRGDHFHDGVDLISGNDRIYPVSAGQLIFFWDKSLFPTENYPGGGNIRILKHDNYYAVYMHLEDNSVYQKIYSDQDSIGKIGNTGRSRGRHLHLSLLNDNKMKSINPLTLLPVITDSKAPEVKGLSVRIENTYYYINKNDTIRLTRHYPLLVNIIDSIAGNERLGIYKLKISINGIPALETDFSAITSSKNGLTAGGRIFQDLYDENGYYKVKDIKYINGKNSALIEAADFSGNRSVTDFSFNINLDMQ